MSDTYSLPPLSPAEARHIDQTCDRFEAAWKAGQPPDPAEYLGQAAGPARSALLRQLLLLDWDYRRRAGDDPRPGDYHERFPDDRAVVEDVRRAMSESPVSTRLEPVSPHALDTPWCGDPAEALPAEAVTGEGRYELLREVGQGGIGVVFRSRDRILGRELAVKVLREAYRDNPDARRRFAAEARVGSRLQHPAIVPVYESGQFGDGRPYLAMKLVEGHTLAELLRRRADPARDLARLLAVFEQVCQAVAYAHAQGVVHRDLKPANVMVGAFGEVQVMDWGFAKVLADGGAEAAGGPAPAQPATGRDKGTHSGVLMGTPAYMPPEQARGEAAMIDPRADVFALGAILCEILTGRPAYGGESVKEMCGRAAAGDLADAYARLDACGADAALRDLARRCLAAERAARPPDAGVVAREVADHLASAQERLRRAELERAAAEARAKAERRARRLTLALAAALLLAAGGAAWEAVAATRAKHDADTAAAAETAAKETAQAKEAEARSLLKFFEQRVLAAPRPKGQDSGLGINATIRDALDNAEPEIAKTFADRPPLEAEIRHWLAQTYMQAGEMKLALPQQERALALNRQVKGPDHPDTLGNMNNLAILRIQMGQDEAARQLFEEVVERKRRVLGPEDPGTMRSLSNLAGLTLDQSELDEARKPRKLEEARKLFEEVLPLQRRLLGLDNADTLRSMSNLAAVLQGQGHLEEARKLLEEVIPLQQRTLGREHPEAVLTLNNLGIVLEAQGQLEEARKLYEEALPLLRRVLGPKHPEIMSPLRNLATLAVKQGRLEDARNWYEEAVRHGRSALPAGHPQMLLSMNGFARMLATAPDLKFRDPPRAVELAKEVVHHAPEAGEKWTTLGVASYRAGAWKDAIAALEKSEALAPGMYVADNALYLAMAHWQLGEKEVARRWYDTAIDWIEKNRPTDPDLPRFRAEAAQLLGVPNP